MWDKGGEMVNILYIYCRDKMELRFRERSVVKEFKTIS